jgi:hypothetical protein
MGGRSAFVIKTSASTLSTAKTATIVKHMITTMAITKRMLLSAMPDREANYARVVTGRFLATAPGLRM